MSTDLSFGEYVLAIVEALEVGEPTSLQRMRAVVGSQHAVLRLDKERIELWFEPTTEELSVLPLPSRKRRSGKAARVPDTASTGTDVVSDLPHGGTDSATVLSLMRGQLEFSEAIVAGLIDAHGSVEQVTAISVAIEIVIDAATRVPAIVALARHFHERRASNTPSFDPLLPLSIRTVARREHLLLERLDLLDAGLH